MSKRKRKNQTDVGDLYIVLPGHWSLHGTYDTTGVLVGVMVPLFPMAARPDALELVVATAFSGPLQRLC
jgi:hypothetical protein